MNLYSGRSMKGRPMTDAIPEPNTLTVRLVISPIAAPDPWRTSATVITDGLTTAIKPLSNKILRFRPEADVAGVAAGPCNGLEDNGFVGSVRRVNLTALVGPLVGADQKRRSITEPKRE